MKDHEGHMPGMEEKSKQPPQGSTPAKPQEAPKPKQPDASTPSGQHKH